MRSPRGWLWGKRSHGPRTTGLEDEGGGAGEGEIREVKGKGKESSHVGQGHREPGKVRNRSASCSMDVSVKSLSSRRAEN